MSEWETIQQTARPWTRADLARELARAGVARGDTLLAHTSLSALGWVCGGPVAVIQALLDAIGPSGTLVMPAHSGELSDPSGWRNPPVPEGWWPIIRESMPAYEPEITPTLGVGRIPEIFRRWPGTLRSAHPAHSFAALGPQAAAILEGHGLDHGLGERSPLARLYNQRARVLLLGCGYASNTCFHLAEYRVLGGRPIRAGAPMLEEGVRRWIEYDEIELDDDPFEAIGAAFEVQQRIVRAAIGSATARLFALRDAVDFAVTWLAAARLGQAPP